MKIETEPKNKYRYATFGGKSFFALRNRQIIPYPGMHSGQLDPPWKDLKLLTLMWRLMKIFFRFGNQEIHYHICGSGGDWEVPMNAENVEVRLTNCGPKVTIW